jgi:hypothetical protein
MVFKVKATVKAGAATKKLASIRRNLPIKLQNGLDRHASFATKYLRDTRFKPYPGFAGEDKSRKELYMRTRKLRKSIRHEQIAKGKNVGTRIMAGQGVGDNRARLQEFGGVVTGNPWVDIPLEGALTSTGRLKARYPSAAAALKEKGVFQVHLRTGAGFIILHRGANKITPLFVQKHTVTIPGPNVGTESRFKFRETLTKNPTVVTNREDMLREGLRKAKGKK